MRLLLAEDERSLSRALTTILKHNNYSVDAAFDGEEALVYLETQEYDLLILDVMMPKKDGFEVLKTLRERKSNLPVLMLTARNSVEDKVRGLDGGADDYLAKPFDTRELLARVRALCRRQPESAVNGLIYGDLRLDTSSYELICGDKKFPLTSKEFQIIEMLMRNPGKVISTERFMESVWGLDSEAEINVVWTYVSYLRKKLKQLGSVVSIKAVRHLGYSLEKSDD